MHILNFLTDVKVIATIAGILIGGWLLIKGMNTDPRDGGGSRSSGNKTNSTTTQTPPQSNTTETKE